MGLLSNFFRSDTNLTRPDFEKSGKEMFNFSDNIIEIADPQQTALIPLKPSKNHIDIYNMGSEYKQKRGHHAQFFYERGWDFWGKEQDPKGGVICDMRIIYIPEKLKNHFNQFNGNDQALSLLLHWFIIWGDQAEAPKLGVKGKDTDFVYPVNRKDIEPQERQNAIWLRSSGTY